MTLIILVQLFNPIKCFIMSCKCKQNLSDNSIGDFSEKEVIFIIRFNCLSTDENIEKLTFEED